MVLYRVRTLRRGILTLMFVRTIATGASCPMRLMRLVFGASLAIVLLLSACSRSTPGLGSKKIRIGFSMDSLQLERWQRDRDLFTRRAQELGAEVLVQSADGNDSVQVRQAENLLTQGVDVLVVV